MSSSLLSFVPGVVVGGRYRIEEQIGQGGFGAVFRATQLALDRPVALKVLLAEGADPSSLDRFRREAELVQRLAHPNTVRLLDFGHADASSPYLVFELLEGGTLEEAIRRGGAMPAARVARIAAQLIKALMEAHSLGIVHRDLKPANIFLSNHRGDPDFVKVLDFGIAKAIDSTTLTARGGAIGTPAYMAPEQVLGREATFASDLYALGLSMSEALAGRPVFEGLSLGEIIREQTSQTPAPHAPEVLQSPLGALIHRATQKAVARRHGSAAEMLAHLEASMDTHLRAPFAAAAASASPHLGHAPTRAPRPARATSGRRPWVLAGAGAAMFAGAFGLVFLLAGGRARDPRRDVRALPVAGGRAAEPADDAPVKGSQRLSELTVELIMQRGEALGFDVSSNSVMNRDGTTRTSVSFERLPLSVQVHLTRYAEVRYAVSSEKLWQEKGEFAVHREDNYEIMVSAAQDNRWEKPEATRFLRKLLR